MDFVRMEQRQYQEWKAKKPKMNEIKTDRSKLNAKVLHLVEMYRSGENIEYAIGGLETINDLFGGNLLERYSIKKTSTDNKQ